MTARRTTTCIRCRIKKLKCDRGHPCRACERSLDKEPCEYPDEGTPRVYSSPYPSQQPQQQQNHQYRVNPPQDPSSSNPASLHLQPGVSQPSSPDRRRRPVFVCTRCRSLKLKCDREQPCSGCARSGWECTYTARHTREWTWVRAGDTGQGGGAMERAGAESSSQPRTGTLDLEDNVLGPSGMRGSSASRDGESSNLSRRLAAVEAQLAAIQQPAAPPHQPAPVNDLIPSTLAGLVAVLPSVHQCRRLLQRFLRFDVLLRIVHATSFMRRMEGLLDMFPAEPIGDEVGLALLTGALFTGALASEDADAEVAPHLHLITERLLDMCDDAPSQARASRGQQQPGQGTEYVLAHLIFASALVVGPASSPTRWWIALGRVRHAAHLVRLDLDVHRETVFQRELRRRVWWNIVWARDLLTERLQMERISDVHIVPRPLVISDAALDTMDPDGTLDEDCDADGFPPEWAFCDSKLDLLDMFATRDNVLAGDGCLLYRLDHAHEIIDRYRNYLPEHLSMQTTQPRPPWAYMQGYILAVAIDDCLVKLYLPYLSNIDPQVSTLALERARAAAHGAIDKSKTFMHFMLLEWPDAPAPGIWSFSMKAFTSGMMLAYALLSRSSHPDGQPAPDPADAEGLDTAVTLLRTMASLAGSTAANGTALRTLVALRAASTSTSGSEVLDPFTGRSHPLPPPPARAPSPLEIPAAGWEWEACEWESLFRDLFAETMAGGGGGMEMDEVEGGGGPAE